MSLLLNEPKVKSLCKRNVSPTKSTCWEFLECTSVLCPVHGELNMDCWLVPKTLCNNFIAGDFFEKLPECLTCPYFEVRSKETTDCGHFIADQLKKYNLRVLEQIYQKEVSFVEILNRIPDGLFTTDREYRITYFNPAAERITGFSAPDAVGMYCKDVFKSQVCENDCALKKAVLEGKDIHNQEYTIRNIDGEDIPIMCSTSVFQEISGQMTGGIEIFREITEMKKLQEEIGNREKKYRRMFEGSGDMVYIANRTGKLLDVNQAGVEMLGYQSKERLLGIDSVRELYVIPSEREKFVERIDRDGYVKNFETDFRKYDGSRIHVLISSRRYENSETGDSEYEGIIKDITNRKLTEDILRDRNRELSVLNSIAVDLNLTTQLDDVIPAILDHVLTALRLQRGAFFLIDRDRGEARVQVTYGLPMVDPNRVNEVAFEDTLLKKRLIEDGETLMPSPTFPSFQASYRTKSGEFVSWLDCFLITFKGSAVAFLGLYIPSYRVLTQNELHLLGSLGNFLGGTIVNTQLTKTIRSHRQELRKLTQKLFQSQEEERRSIARELHDETGQALTAIKLGLDRLEEKVFSEGDGIKKEIGEIRDMLVRTSSEIRRISFHLHPTMLTDLGLEPALKFFFKRITKHSGLDVDFRMIGFDRGLDPDLEIVFYRFSQEVTTNVLKHSCAKHLRLSIIKSYPKIIFKAEDDGAGFDAENPDNYETSLGLLGMRERAYQLGGVFQVQSKPGFGTRIRIEIPFSEDIGHESDHNDFTC